MKNKKLLLAGLLLIALNLRAPFTIVAPLLEGIAATFSLSATQAGLLITLPLLAFAAVSPFAAGVASKWGIERTLFIALGVIGAGILLRVAGNAACLYLGTAIIGAGIAFGNVLLPSLLKRDFADKVAPLTSVYVLMMGAAAAASSAIVLPLARFAGTDWRTVSLVTLVLIVVAAVAWLPQLRSAPPAAASNTAGTPANQVWRSPLAWLVTAYLGLDSFLYYVGVSWLPSILRDTAGYTAEQAASLHGVLLLASALPGLILIPLTARLRDQRLLAAGIASSMVIGLFGFVLAPELAVVWIVFFGVGAGGGLIVALAFLSLRTANARDASSLSGMAQSVGYLIAAAGPTVIGRIHDLAGSWNLPLTLCGAVGIVMATIGLYAGRNVQIGVNLKQARKKKGATPFKVAQTERSLASQPN